MGAAVASAGDNNALAGAISAGGAEAAAPIISHYLYNEQDGSKLTAEQKETVTAITGLLGTAIGAAVGNTTADAVSGSLIAQNAVGNNELAFNVNSQENAVLRFNQKIRRELGNKFELRNIGRKNEQDYEIVELVALQSPDGKNSYTVSDLDADE
ncbi:VENN motif pre-toxin domain-containing protein [Neisseria shayeganii]|uniref:HecA family adhesin/hemagglutinin n=1 Tax=Neisseria shayeganii 871 TaxID=1032488 RepID=G4CF90_9NEIS|nr:VENN motif pre-toxin domain-containing protein [Neisseria shayeganii]EGY53534.1 HecA family adhesin/hemagglutinin [Neisseria shayeganii 871]